MNEQGFNIELTPWGRNFYGVGRDRRTEPHRATKRKLLKNQYRHYKGPLSLKKWIVWNEKRQAA